MSVFVQYLLCLCFALVCLSCVRVRPVYLDEDKKAVDAAVRQFIDRFNDQDYESIYNDASTTFKAAYTYEAVLPIMKETRLENGKILEVTDKWLKAFPGAQIQVRTIYNVKCEKGERSFWFVYLVGVDGKPSLAQVEAYGGYTDISKYKNEDANAQ